MKKNILLLFLLLIVLLPLNVKALSVDKNDLTIEKGGEKSIDLYANVEENTTEVSFTLVYTTYDIPAYFSLEPGLTDRNPNGIAHRIIFSNPVSGKIKLGTIDIDVVNSPKVSTGAINIHTASAQTSNGTVYLNSQTINVTIGDEIEETPALVENETNLLDKIESEMVKIDLEKNKYEYTIEIKEDVEELDLKAIPKNENYEVEISNQKIKELEDNKIIIKVKDGDNTEEYIIKVNTIKNKVEKVETNKENKEKKENSYEYKGKWIVLIVIMSIALVIGLILTKKK